MQLEKQTVMSDKLLEEQPTKIVLLRYTLIVMTIFEFSFLLVPTSSRLLTNLPIFLFSAPFSSYFQTWAPKSLLENQLNFSFGRILDHFQGHWVSENCISRYCLTNHHFNFLGWIQDHPLVTLLLQLYVMTDEFHQGNQKSNLPLLHFRRKVQTAKHHLILLRLY